MDLETTTVQKRRRSPTIAMHKQSKTLTKSKPKIRIIHLFSPEIIKTDVSNFRKVVQNLTGKVDLHQKTNPRSRGSHVDDHYDQDQDQVQDMKKSHGFCINSEDMSMSWNGNGGESSGGFLNGLGEFDGFIAELGEFPYLPLTIDHTVASSSHFAESQQFA